VSGQETTLHTPGTGFPDQEAKIAFGLARLGVEATGIEAVSLQNVGGYYRIEVGCPLSRLTSAFATLSGRVLSSANRLARRTPGVTGRSADNLVVEDIGSLSLDEYASPPTATTRNTPSDTACRHAVRGPDKVSNVLGLTALGGYHHARDGINTQSGPYGVTRPTSPKRVCRTCALLAVLGQWAA